MVRCQSRAAIKEANEAVKRARGSYAKFIAKYASMHGNQAAVRHFSKELEVQLKIISVQTWKTKYLTHKQKASETDDLTMMADQLAASVEAVHGRDALCARFVRCGCLGNLEMRNFILKA